MIKLELPMFNDAIVAEIGLKGRFRRSVPLNKMCWFGSGGPADVVYQPADINDLQQLIIYLGGRVPLEVFGVGSNLLIRDGGIEGIVIRLGRAFNWVKVIEGSKVGGDDIVGSIGGGPAPIVVRVGANTMDLNLAQFAAEQGIGGLEFYSGIPGTIGGALAMNAGAYGCDTASRLLSVLAINKSTGEIRRFSNCEMGFVYRGNGIGQEWIFLEADFIGFPDDPADVQMRIAAIQESRRQTQPVNARTGGSTFKNPPNYGAWQLIDAAGCRQLRVGGARMSEMHCNFVINDDEATSGDIEALIALVAQRVESYSGIRLKREIVILGRALERDN